MQVDVAWVGGITPWLKVAHMAEAMTIAVCPHFPMELHVSLVCAIPNSWMLEYIPQLDPITRSRLDIRAGMAHPPETAGLGIDWDHQAIKAQTIFGSHSDHRGQTMQRMGMVIGLKPDKIEVYKRLHAAVWSEILAQISACNITNYSIYLKQPENLLFGYWEYRGTDFAADAAKMAADPKTQEWWAVCMPCQEPLATRKDGEWWSIMDEVFHHD